MDLKDLNKYIEKVSSEILSEVSEIVAETATEYFKQTFSKKAFNGNPWMPAKVPKKNGSLLIDSGALVNSIRPAFVSRQKVVISAGNDKVDYAQIHNEGYHGALNIPQHTRNLKSGKTVSVKQHIRNVNIPQRQFMGNSEELNNDIHERLEKHINSKISKL